MADCPAVHHQNLQEIYWESLESFSSDPNLYLENLLKEVTTLHQVLIRHFLPSTLQTGDFRASFRFLYPARPVLTFPLPSSAHVEKLSNLSEGLPPTFPDTKVAESEVASGTLSPTPSQPPKLTLSLLLAALATNRKSSPPSLVTS
ncbi:hypothetical protein O181_025405 [Austropuccinia psidii MF-1]|uniref:Uncharacterized protein n=1 Tax=Austropuccinia psidii MF-1 TaxID=1389203 RepID=A0A9Q3CME2_9BASI|nr:hypothetical protein [Austropuccinia psidii MF-1]